MNNKVNNGNLYCQSELRSFSSGLLAFLKEIIIHNLGINKYMIILYFDGTEMKGIVVPLHICFNDFTWIRTKLPGFVFTFDVGQQTSVSL